DPMRVRSATTTMAEDFMIGVRVGKRVLSFAALLILVVTALPTRADEADEKGLAIAREQDRRESGFGDYSALFTMILRTPEGKEAQRQMRILNLEVEGDGDKSLTIFDAPK